MSDTSLESPQKTDIHGHGRWFPECDIEIEKIEKEIKKEIPGMPLFYEINGAVNKFSFGMQIVMLHLEAS